MSSTEDRQADVDLRIGELLTETERLGRRNRNSIRLLAASVAFDIALSFGLGAFSFQVHNLTRATARSASANRVATCNSGNQARALNRQLWMTVLPEIPGLTPAQISNLKAFISQTFAQRDCSKVG